MELIAKVTIQGAGDRFAVPGTESARFDTEAFGISDAEAQVLVRREFAEVPKIDAAPAAEIAMPAADELQPEDAAVQTVVSVEQSISGGTAEAVAEVAAEAVAAKPKAGKK